MEKNTVTLHRVLTAKPEKVFRAFAQAKYISSWLPPNGFVCTVQAFDFKVGGQYKMSFHNFTIDNSHSFGGHFLEIIEGKWLKYNDRFDDPNMPGEITTTIKFTEVNAGTELEINQTGIPDMIPVDMCYLGWQESLEKLKRLVEPNIPDA
jgi:uncharacterized protein YndB with AHSA1/START domain